MKLMRLISMILCVIAMVSFGFVQYRSHIMMDNVPPEIHMEEGKISVSVSAPEEAFLEGITAEDNRDGDVSESLLVESMSNFIETGTRKVTIIASDHSGNVAKVEREVTYTDYKRPKFKLEAPLRFRSGGTPDLLENLTAKDSLDGDLTSQIKIASDSTIYIDEPDDYPMVFLVSNSAGDTVKLPVTVTVYDQSQESAKPTIELSKYIAYTKVGQKIDPWKFVERITYRSEEYERKGDVLKTTSKSDHQPRYTISESEVQIESNVKYKKAGTYEVLYRFAAAEDPEEEDYGSVRLIVVVTE